MSLSIIVMGASGRMGTTIANLAKEQGMTLAAVLERPERLDALAHWGCLAGTDPEVVYPQVPGAVVIDFTAPESSLANARCAVKNGNPIVIGTTGFTPEQKAELIAKNPAYGRVICRCETITEGEILDALQSEIPAVSIDGVKRRCNAGMGRCQGGFCGPRVLELISKTRGIDPLDVLQDKAGTNVLLCETKTGRGCNHG